MIKTYNIAIFVIVGLILWLLKLEYQIEFTKPVCIILGLVVVKLWLRRVNTATYILFHVVLFGAGYLWIRHYLDSKSTFDLVAMATELLREAGTK